MGEILCMQLRKFLLRYCKWYCKWPQGKAGSKSEQYWGCKVKIINSCLLLSGLVYLKTRPKELCNTKKFAIPLPLLFKDLKYSIVYIYMYSLYLYVHFWIFHNFFVNCIQVQIQGLKSAGRERNSINHPESKRNRKCHNETQKIIGKVNFTPKTTSKNICYGLVK